MSENQRQFSRCPVDGDDSSAVLVVNRRPIDCRLVEMSIGGFGVITPRQLRVGRNELACLKARGLEYIVRITHQKRCDDGVFVGLKQVEEVLPDNSTSPESPGWLTTAVWATALSTVAAAVYWHI